MQFKIHGSSECLSKDTSFIVHTQYVYAKRVGCFFLNMKLTKT